MGREEKEEMNWIPFSTMKDQFKWNDQEVDGVTILAATEPSPPQKQITKSLKCTTIKICMSPVFD